MKKLVFFRMFLLCFAPAITVSAGDAPYIFTDNFTEGWTVERCGGKDAPGKFVDRGLSYNFSGQGESALMIKKNVQVPVDKNSRIKLSLTSDGLRQRIFIVVKDRSGESFFCDGGRCFSKGNRTLIFPMKDFFVKQEEIDGNVWGGDTNKTFDPPLTEIIVGVDNYPDGIVKEGLIETDVLEITGMEQSDSAVNVPAPPVAPAPQVEPYTENVISNGSFEMGAAGGRPDGWSCSRGIMTREDGGVDGKYCAGFSMDAKYPERLGAFISQVATVPGGLKKGDVWFFSGWIRACERVRIGIVLGECPKGSLYSEKISCTLCPEDGWMHFLIPYQIQSSLNTSLKPHIYVYEPDKPVFIDDIRISKAPEDEATTLSSEMIKRRITARTIVPSGFEN